MSSGAYRYLDSLYGDCQLSEAVHQLVSQPLVQRLREIRLSNIDSLAMPGISNISRFEHSIATAFLASRVSFARRMTPEENLMLQAACLLHDSAMQPFGHLVEEALEYVDVNISHEERWKQLAADPDISEVGGIDLQIYLGRQSGLQAWAERAFGPTSKTSLSVILDAISGHGHLGPAVCGDLDLDNLDNVARAAYHMGLELDRSLPIRIVEQMVGIGDAGLVFADGAISTITQWLELRSRVYERFMLSRSDFVGKVMLIYATTRAHANGELTRKDWILTDRDFLQKLLASPNPDVSDTVKRWLSGEAWSLSNLWWMEGPVPSYRDVFEFSVAASKKLGRTCFAYRIKDKTTRHVRVHLVSGESADLGVTPRRWLLGVGSPLRKAFTGSEDDYLVASAAQRFGCSFAGIPVNDASEAPQSLLLFANS